MGNRSEQRREVLTSSSRRTNAVPTGMSVCSAAGAALQTGECHELLPGLGYSRSPPVVPRADNQLAVVYGRLVDWKDGMREAVSRYRGVLLRGCRPRACAECLTPLASPGGPPRTRVTSEFESPPLQRRRDRCELGGPG